LQAVTQPYCIEPVNSAGALKRRTLAMKYIATLFFCLLQTVAVANPQSPAHQSYSQLDQAESELESSVARMQLEREALRQQAKYEEDEFVKRVNNLLSVLRDLSSTYNGGHVVNVKRIKEMRKALHDLEKSAWFRSYKDN
jgi:hypothetical protein